MTKSLISLLESASLSPEWRPSREAQLAQSTACMSPCMRLKQRERCHKSSVLTLVKILCATSTSLVLLCYDSKRRDTRKNTSTMVKVKRTLYWLETYFARTTAGGLPCGRFVGRRGMRSTEHVTKRPPNRNNKLPTTFTKKTCTRSRSRQYLQNIHQSKSISTAPSTETTIST